MTRSPTPYGGRVPVVVYSAQRLVLFLLALALLAWLQVGGWLLVVLAALISAAVAYLALRRSRDAAVAWLAQRDERRRGPRADELAEDAQLAAGSQRQTEPEQDPVAELEQPGAGEHRPEQDPARPEQHRGGQDPDRQGEQQHQQ